MFKIHPTSYETIQVQIEHLSHSKNIKKVNTKIDFAIYEGQIDDLHHALSQGWEIKSSVLLPINEEKGKFMEIIRLSRNNLNPNFKKETYSDKYLEKSQKLFKQ
jgi:galactokinase/mevalonate kinase-like predicted kinase